MRTLLSDFSFDEFDVNNIKFSIKKFKENQLSSLISHRNTNHVLRFVEKDSIFYVIAPNKGAFTLIKN